MKAVVIKPAQRELIVVEVAEPRIEHDTQVLVRILEVGICGTDREIAALEYGTPPAGEDQLVLGHEALAEVVSVGARVEQLQPGDLVVPSVRRPCDRPECLACRSGRQDFCYTGEFRERGIQRAHGYMTEFVVDEAAYMSRVPRALREVAVLVEPLTIAAKAMSEVWTVQARLPWGCPVDVTRPRAYCRRALVLGAGPVGLLGAMTAVLNGFQTYVLARAAGRSGRTKLIEQIGATYLASEAGPISALVQRVGDIDLVFEATGSSRLSFEVLPFLRPNCIFVLTGVPAQRGPREVDLDRVMRNMVLKNQVLLGTVNAGVADFEQAISDLAEFLRRWPDAVCSLVSRRHPIDEAPALLRSPARGTKEIIGLT